MMNSIIRSTWNWCHRSALPSCFNQRLQCFASFTIKDILYETPSQSGTLLTRFAKHIAVESYAFDALVRRTIRYSDYFPPQDLRFFKEELNKVPTDQLPALIVFAFTYRSNGDPNKFAQILNELDGMCLRRIPEMDNNTLLRTLYSLLFLIPDKITRTDFYHRAVCRLVKEFASDFPKEKFVQVCFYSGLVRGNSDEISDLLNKFLEQHLEAYTAHLSQMDLAIVASAIYKTSTRISSDSFLQRLQQELLSSSMDDALLVTFIKCLRLQRVKSDKVCERLKEYCEPTALRALLPSGLIHIFAYFAENRWDAKYIQNIVNEFMIRIKMSPKSEFGTSVIRAKDLATFLWCCAQLNVKISTLNLNSLEAEVLHKVHTGEFANFADSLVDCGLNLWILGLKSRSILDEASVLKERNMLSKKQRRDHSKIDNRFTILQSAAAIEYPLWQSSVKGFEEDCPAPTYLVKGRDYLTNYVERLSAEKDVAAVKLVCPINGINIAGILAQFVESDQKIFVELLDQEQVLKFSQEPVAILKLRQSLLTSLGYEVVHIRLEDLADRYTCLRDLVLKDKIPEVKEKSCESIGK